MSHIRRLLSAMAPSRLAPRDGYNKAAERAAMNSTFAPATHDGKPVEGWITVAYHFGRPR